MSSPSATMNVDAKSPAAAPRRSSTREHSTDTMRSREKRRERRSRSPRDRSDRDRDGRSYRHGGGDRDRRRDDRRDSRDRRSKRPEDDEPKRKRSEAPDMAVDGTSPSSRKETRERSREPERKYGGDRRRDDYDSRRRGSDRRYPDDDRERQGGRRDSRRSPPPKAANYEAPAEEPYNPEEVKEDDSEARSVFVSQLAARLTARDLGYFFEDKLGEGTVMDSRIVTDRLSRRSKGIGYVEFRAIDLVEKAIALTGTVVMGLPIMVQLTESERNKLHPGDGNLNLPPGVSAPHGGAMQLYVGSLHFNLTESDIKQVFEPFGDLEFVDLHRDPMTGRSKGYAFVQYKKTEDAKMALEQMEGFELAGRQLRVNTVHEKGTVRYTQQDSLDEAGGGNLNAASRQALMQKLARTEMPTYVEPVINSINAPAQQSRSVLLKNMFDPEEETERDWDKDLADDVKGECQEKYGPVSAIKVERETQGEIYLKFDTIETAKKAIDGLNGRWFGGKQVTAAFIPDAIMQAHQ